MGDSEACATSRSPALSSVGVAVAAVPVLLALVLVLVAGQRRARLVSLRARWGRPVRRTHKLGVLAETHHDRTVHLGEPAIDQRTGDDLLLDAVFVSADRTISTLGQDALYHRLHTLGTADEVRHLEGLVTRFTDDAAARERAQMALTRLQDPNGYNVWWLADARQLPRHAWHVVFPFLTAGAVCTIALAAGGAVPWSYVLLPLLANLSAWFLARHQIAALSLAMRQLAPLAATGEGLAFLASSGSAIAADLPGDALCLRRLKHLSRWLNGDPLMLAHSLEGPALLITALAGIVYEYTNIALLLDANGALLAGADLRRRGGTVVRLARAVGDVDCALSVASWRAERDDWAHPNFATDTASVDLEDLRHPLLPDAVPNTLLLPLGRGMVITGSNMSGKSTFLRTVGVNVVLAQRLGTCLASRYEAPFMSVRSCIGRSDDLESGKSYYMTEVEAVLSLVEASTLAQPHLFLLDELFRGTNTVERVSAGCAVLGALVQPDQGLPRHIVLAATHDGEVVEILGAGYDACHFGDAIGPDGLVFDFRMRPGPATTRNAIALLAQCGAPASIVGRATATAAAMDQARRRAS